MRLVNHSGQPAELMQGEIVPGQMHGSVLTRLRCRLGPDSSLSLATGDDALLDLRRDRIEDEYGVIEPDIPYPRTATDVIVLADARCPGGPKVATKVGLRVGPYEQELLVIGDRVWERSLGAVTPSSPVPFELMPLTWAHAFGGPAQGPYGPVQHPANPLGKGYALDAGAAVGQPLPNIEDPQAPIRAWNDRPDPVGFGPYPFNWLLRQQQCVEIVPGPEREARLLMYPERGMFDRAHPRLSGQQLRPGDEGQRMVEAARHLAPEARRREDHVSGRHEAELGEAVDRSTLGAGRRVVDVERYAHGGRGDRTGEARGGAGFVDLEIAGANRVRHEGRDREGEQRRDPHEARVIARHATRRRVGRNRGPPGPHGVAFLQY